MPQPGNSIRIGCIRACSVQATPEKTLRLLAQDRDQGRRCGQDAGWGRFPQVESGGSRLDLDRGNHPDGRSSVVSRIGTGEKGQTRKRVDAFVFTAGRLIDYDEEVSLFGWTGDAPSHSINGPGITRAWSTIMSLVLKSPSFDPGAVIPRRH